MARRVGEAFPDHTVSDEALRKSREDARRFAEQMRELRSDKPFDRQISELKVNETMDNKFYVGREQYDKDLGQWLPYNPVSEPKKHAQQAHELLGKAKEFQSKLNDFDTDQLKHMYNSFTEGNEEGRLKRALISDTLDVERSPERAKMIQPSRSIDR